MANFFTNAFSLNMLADPSATLHVHPLTAAEAAHALSGQFTHAVGHADTAAVIADLLGVPVPVSRITVQMHPGDCAIVAQYRGPRLPEGATTLPEGANITFALVEVESLQDFISD